MGLFSGETKITITVATQAVRVIPDDKLPNSVISGATKGLKTNTSITDNVLNYLSDSVGVRAHTMYKQAKKKYALGMPSGQFLAMDVGQSAILKAIAKDKKVAETDISLEYSYYMPKNLYHMAWQDLMIKHEYDPTTNKLGKLSKELKQNVYLDDLVLYVREEVVDLYTETVLESWGKPTSSFYSPSRFHEVDSNLYKHSSSYVVVPNQIDMAQFKVTYSYKIVLNPLSPDYTSTPLSPVLKSGEFSLPARLSEIESKLDTKTDQESNPNIGADFYQLKYRINDKTFIDTKPGDALSPLTDIEKIFGVPKTSAGNFFPFIYFRWDKKDLSVDYKSEEYKDSVRIMKSFGMNYDDMCRSIHYKEVQRDVPGETVKQKDLDPNSKTFGQMIDEPKKETVYDTNPRTGKKEARIERTDDPGGQLADVKSVFLFMAIPANTKNDLEIRYLFSFFLEWSSDPQNKSSNELIIEDSGNNKNRNYTQKVEGYSTITIQDKRFKMSLQNQGIELINEFHSRGTHLDKETNKEIPDADYTFELQGSDHIYTFQNSDFTRIRVIVKGLRLVYYTGSGVSAGYTDIADDKQNTDRKHMLIPLDLAITKKWSIADREQLYSRGQHLIYNTEKITVTKIPWYATGFFKIFIMIIVLIITVIIMIFCPPAGIVLAGTLLAAGATMAAVVVIIEMIIEAIIFAVIMHFVLKAIAKLIGPVGAIILGIVAMVAAAAMGGIALAQDTPLLAQSMMSDAMMMMSIATGLISAAGTELQHRAIKEITKETNDFNALVKNKDEELANAQTLLNDNSHLLTPFIIPGESSEQYYDRTIHVGNPGVACFDLMTSFCDILLTLPTLNTTANF